MNLNATMLGQAISFAIFVWLCMKYVWPPLVKLLDERQQEIAQGLRNTEDAAQALALTQANCEQMLDQAKKDVNKLIEQGQKRRAQIIEESVKEAEEEKARIVAQGDVEVEAERNRLRQELKAEMADLVIQSAQKLINKNLDTASNRDLVDQMIKQI
ncbi:F0F1 ATP synthase subunit B [Vibrio scophthalmi]|uniref:ATP synthase subunit b n=1 Tax=Vibrio scophthalmi TaxID=45658 RepID=A0A1C7FBE9_9VIBR|nr:MULTISPECIES: F0F1 ATP synthase subunit B [Vibrio]ANU37058.1 ATP synthase subunit b [Vibrio scophthalmi]EGU30352.1 ATP synthase subunit B [Vibrio sp. N418]MCY9802191.1 F0F1 ATP synthase subunit B [Vibrio scophthalmi]